MDKRTIVFLPEVDAVLPQTLRTPLYSVFARIATDRPASISNLRAISARDGGAGPGNAGGCGSGAHAGADVHAVPGRPTFLRARAGGARRGRANGYVPAARGDARAHAARLRAARRPAPSTPRRSGTRAWSA